MNAVKIHPVYMVYCCRDRAWYGKHQPLGIISMAHQGRLQPSPGAKTEGTVASTSHPAASEAWQAVLEWLLKWHWEGL